MKCDELEPIEFADDFVNGNGIRYYDKHDVDEAIAELKDVIEKNQSAYYVDLGILADDVRKAKRALWLARAYIANIGKRLAISNRNKELKEKVERFCRAKAKEYK